jgi:tRNA A37 N6-isopentenylltransferase MiaA
VRHYAKRQLTWFRRETGAEWFEGFGEEHHLQSAIMKALQGSLAQT